MGLAYFLAGPIGNDKGLLRVTDRPTDARLQSARSGQFATALCRFDTDIGLMV